jgi:hypothetical protein
MFLIYSDFFIKKYTPEISTYFTSFFASFDKFFFDFFLFRGKMLEANFALNFHKVNVCVLGLEYQKGKGRQHARKWHDAAPAQRKLKHWGRE